ncbi:hypothetical protein SPSYN_02693 [Sporotomaculum syntrophicum]|uniref:Uncharacterized protein n=1 Tax=Sporotomaculum syntrophicum TaxID=182264 RepID=A0A9D2WMG3_9FIRM|nr:hypothetical protein SPSYN_03147 [Sporotomaculum syntrophicum]KAF1084289.1 hypothetical protein SPSYN_02693 [Sporotomaculum syntrophicum]
MGIKDRFNNQITFKHTEKPVANYTPNNDFEYEETVGLWKTSGESRIKAPFSYDEEFGKDDTSSLKYSGTVKSKALSNFIPVLPNTEYYYSAYFKDQLNNGYTQLSCRVYDHNFDVIQMGFLAPRAKDEWCFAQSSMPTSEHLYHNV